MEEYFKSILDDDEKVVKVVKPKKSVMYAKSMILSSIWVLIIFAFAFVGVLLEMLEDPEVIELGNQTTVVWVLILFCIVLPLVVNLLLQWVLMHLSYKNTFYGYTNKRVIIRKGIFGVDYKSLDLKMIGASVVNVTLLDKILRKNTGSINFGSMASPISGATIGNFIFANVEAPYELYKEIKSHISSVMEKDEKSKSE